jgi:hypothetical protein
MIRNLQKSITITGETKTEFGNIRQNNEIKNGVINAEVIVCLALKRTGHEKIKPL